MTERKTVFSFRMKASYKEQYKCNRKRFTILYIITRKTCHCMTTRINKRERFMMLGQMYIATAKSSSM